ncbi:MAG TPA: GNAT family N-acetyltransferase, partial [Actinophytocola sp.]|uniref:GNAT family N-acetyltransferase n=1 Tax=Actinophytocola sp. TaxID=1872138 RepID=UPI002DDD357F
DAAAPAAGAASAAARRAGVTVRSLDTPAGTAAAADLFSAIWHAPAEAAPVSADLMTAFARTGNYVAGAYSGDALVGAAVAFFTDETPRVLHSHICGVAPAGLGRGVGFALKLHQRAWALDRGIGTITWTVDPLVRRNIYFNLAKLGGTATEHLLDYYGPMKDGVNVGDPSDRLLITWNLTAPEVAAACAGSPVVVAAPAAPLLSTGAGGDPVRHFEIAGDHLRCELPDDIVALRRCDPELASTWRHSLRAALVLALHEGYHIAGVDADGHYVLARRS